MACFQLTIWFLKALIFETLIFDRKIGNEQMHFAIGEARAHLIHLESIGFARSETDLNEVVWYQKN